MKEHGQQSSRKPVDAEDFHSARQPKTPPVLGLKAPSGIQVNHSRKSADPKKVEDKAKFHGINVSIGNEHTRVPSTQAVAAWGSLEDTRGTYRFYH